MVREAGHDKELPEGEAEEGDSSGLLQHNVGEAQGGPNGLRHSDRGPHQQGQLQQQTQSQLRPQLCHFHDHLPKPIHLSHVRH